MTKNDYDPELLKSAFLALFKASNYFRLFYDGETEPVPADSDRLTKKDRMYRLYRLNDARECFNQANSKIQAVPNYMDDPWLREARLLMARVLWSFPPLSLPDYPGFKDYAKPEAFKKLVERVDEFSLRWFPDIHDSREKLDVLWRAKSGCDILGYTRQHVVEMLVNNVSGLDKRAATARVDRNTGGYLKQLAQGMYEPNSVEAFMRNQKPKQKKAISRKR